MKMCDGLTLSSGWSARWLLAATWILGNTIPFGHTECSKLTLANTMWQSSREGTYKKTTNTCTGRNVYKQNSGSNYIYYIEASAGWTGWMVGTSPCVNSGGIASPDEAAYPEDVTTNWEEVYSGSWYYSNKLTIKCYRLSGGAIAGIVVGCLLLVGIVITIVVCCCCCKNNKNTNTVQVQHTSNVSTINGAVHYNRGPRPGAQPLQPGYYMGPPAYGAPMVHGYGQPPSGPPPVYSNYPPGGAAGPTSGDVIGNTQGGQPSGANGAATMAQRPPSVPPSYAQNDPCGQGDPFGYSAKVSE